jgi:hypothetical protein
MSDLNDLAKPVTTDTEPNVLDTLRGHIVRSITWAGYGATANRVPGMMSAVTAAVSGGRSLRLYRRNDASTADEEVVTLPGISVGGNAATASAAQSGSALEGVLNAKAPINSPGFLGTPTTPNVAAGTNNTQIANTAFVQTAVANLVQSAPAALDTLSELSAALGGDANFASTTATALGNRVVRTSANRPGVYRLYRNDSDDAYNAQFSWQTDRTGYWSIRGYSNDTYHAGVYVAYAGYADSAGSAPASDVSAWAKAATKPSYSKSEVGLGSVDNTADSAKSVNYASTAGRAYPRRSDGGDLNFNWSGQGGQPAWLWGGTDGANMYVYNPSNFSVNYANSAGSAGSAGYATNAGYANSAGSALASDVYSWAKQPSKPSYSASELGFTNSFATSGYIKFPNGMILQWGEYAAQAGNSSITFSIAFPNACVYVGDMPNYSTAIYAPALISKSKIGATIFTYGTLTLTHQYIAIGY